ncbi:MAG: hypothetical protein OXE40_09195 [Gammaproteobacteria bacterium]|nr:hypothetical protein [Gammaproteobacteria bacterium]
MARPKTDLAAAVHSAGRAAAAPAPAVSEVVEPPRASYPRPSRRSTRAIVIHVSPDMRKALRQVALDEDSSLQALGLEAFENLLRSRNVAIP